MVQQEVMLARQTASVQQGGIRLSFPIIVHFQSVRSGSDVERTIGGSSLTPLYTYTYSDQSTSSILVHIEYVGKPAANNMSAYAKREMSTDSTCCFE